MAVEKTDIGRYVDRRDEDLGKILRDRLDLYVAPDAVTASDDNVGTSSEAPLRSLNAAIRRVNEYSLAKAPAVVHLSSATYLWSETLGSIPLQQPIALVGDGAGQEDDDGFSELQTAAAAAAGTGQRVVVDPVGGLTTNVFQGKTIEILSGAAAGDRRTIRNNTATDIIPQIKFSAVVSPGDLFRIVEPAVHVSFGATGFGPGTPIHVSGIGSPGSTSPEVQPQADTSPIKSSLLLSNLNLIDTAGVNLFQMQSTMVYCAGVQMEGATHYFSADQFSCVWSGYDIEGGGNGTAFRLPYELGLADDEDDWQGWGLALLDGAVPYIRNLRGCLVWVDNNTTSSGIYESSWKLRAGAFRNDTFNLSRGGFAARTSTRLFFETLDTNLPFLIQAQGVAGTPAIRAGSGAYIRLENVAIEMGSVAGVGVIAGTIHLHGSTGGAGGRIFLGDNVSITAPDVAVGATCGGLVSYHDAPTLPSAPTTEIATWVGDTAGVATATGTFAGLATGAVLLAVAGDGTVIMRVP